MENEAVCIAEQADAMPVDFPLEATEAGMSYAWPSHVKVGWRHS